MEKLKDGKDIFRMLSVGNELIDCKMLTRYDNISDICTLAIPVSDKWIYIQILSCLFPWREGENRGNFQKQQGGGT